MSILKDFFKECLTLPWKPNSQNDPEHENQVEELLKKHGLKYIAQPNGIQQSPDFRIYYDGAYDEILECVGYKKTIDVECKSSKQAFPLYNSGLPKPGVVYVFSSQKYNSTTIYFADDIVTDKKRELYDGLKADFRKILNEYQCKEGWDDSRGFDFYMRAMYYQTGGAYKTDYFKHSDRMRCEQHVLDEMENAK